MESAKREKIKGKEQSVERIKWFCVDVVIKGKRGRKIGKRKLKKNNH